MCFKPIKIYNINHAFGLKLCNKCFMKKEKENTQKHVIVNNIKAGKKYVLVPSEYFTTLEV